MKTRTKILALIAMILSITAVGVVLNKDGSRILSEQNDSEKRQDYDRGVFSDLDTDISQKSIDLDLVFDGGPGKDGIPAISNPKFVGIADAEESPETLGIFVDINGDQRFYPYSILVWHEIVNDVVGGKKLAITFCPLCGSAIVYNREQEDLILEFGVSGLLYESNLLMYDNITESLWLQALGEAVVGDYLGLELEIVPMQLITTAEVLEKYPDALVMSRETGFRRNYDQIPYEGYEDSKETSFPVSVNDERFFSKEIMYVVPYNKDIWFAFPKDELKAGVKIEQEYNNETFVIERIGGEIIVSKENNIIPGYFEMWFSFATHHQEDGVIWNLN